MHTMQYLESLVMLLHVHYKYGPFFLLQYFKFVTSPGHLVEAVVQSLIGSRYPLYIFFKSNETYLVYMYQPALISI